MELEVFDFLKGKKLRKTLSFHLERLQSERNKRKHIRRGIPLSFFKGLRSDVPKKTTASSRQKNPHPKKHTKNLSGIFFENAEKGSADVKSTFSKSQPAIRRVARVGPHPFWTNYCTMGTPNLHF